MNTTMNDTNTEVMYYFNGSTTGKLPFGFHTTVISSIHRNKKLTHDDLEKIKHQTQGIEEEMREASRMSKFLNQSGFYLDLNKQAIFCSNIIALVEHNMIPNNNDFGYNFFTTTSMPKPVKAKPHTSVTKPHMVNAKPLVNAPIEVDRTAKDFVPKSINVLTKAELVVLGTKLGLTGLTKLNKDELIKRCNTRRSNQHFSNYIDEILCKAFE